MLLGAIAELVNELDIAVDRGELLDAFAVRDALDARITVAVGEFEAAGMHEVDGDLTMQAWLGHHAGRDHRGASKLTAAGRKLQALPVLRAAVLEGRVSGSQLDVVVANVPARHLPRFADHERELVPLLGPLSIADTQRAMVEWRAKADAENERPLGEYDNQVFLSSTIDGRGELRGSLDADRHATVEAALRGADGKDFELKPAQRRADALDTVCRFFLDHHQSRTRCRHRPHLNVAMTYEQFVAGIGATYLDTGGLVSPTEQAVLACDAILHRIVVEGRSAILDYGRATRTPPIDVYNAVVARDHGCRWPGCGRPGSWCDAHHVHEWDAGGPTSIANLVLLCRRHHRKLHAGRGWRAKLLPDATFEITHPDGHVETTEAPGPIPQRLFRTAGGG